MARDMGRHPQYFNHALMALKATGEIVARVTDGRAMEYRLA